MRFVALAMVPGTPKKIMIGTESIEPPPAMTFKKPVATPVIDNKINSNMR